jgi:kynurenine 3-monooxygenase
VSERVTIVGAGLGGSLLSVLLGKEGASVSVYDRRPDPRGERQVRGRSINLAISTRGIHALEQAGLAKRVLEESVPMRGRMIHSQAGDLAFQPYGTEAHHVIHSVSRAGLNRLLVEAAEALPNVTVAFGKRCVGLEASSGTVELADSDTGETSRVEADWVAGADGAYSEVRQQMLKLDRVDYEQSYLEHGYKELSIPALPGGGFAMERNALHIWPRGGFMMIALPNVDGSYTCTCFWPFEGPSGFSSLRDEEQVLSYFRRVFPDVVPLMPTLAEDFLANPIGTLVTVRCRPWSKLGRVLLLGDAAHAIVPFYGQGANAAFEDCVVLDECLRAHPADRERAFAEFEARRKVHTDALAGLAIGNFLEMRDKTASRLFLWGKRTEKVLHKLFPRSFVPLYYMVTFSRTPYADAVRRARMQWKAVGLAALGLLVLVLAVLAIAAGG